ncbi:hypothetical protein Pla110_16310 [Polystyrenella longa]|uniref:Uncharacterized protein n=2 Tax=Polystyrenella longa TaxID=2528007 RepID=A0A518CL07_9PLAN|nr:hypothetical protein Pla110_16310 [Polystyrenella longa]
MFTATGRGCIVLVLSGLLVGCASMHGKSSNSVCTDCESGTCQNACMECESCIAGANCESCNYGCDVKKGSDEWWAMQAEAPVGSRQVYKKGKMWPPYPRPTGPKQQFSHKYHAAHYWPYPYVCQDRAYVRNVMALQEDKGWQRLTTLFDYHFDEYTNELTHSGREQLIWILEEAPPKRRNQIYVQKIVGDGTNAARVETVRNALIELVGVESSGICIELKSGRNYGRPALEIDTIRKAEIESMPEPRINYTAPSTTEED